ncbi:unnamed protein product [Owenia fusiformis]|uniref:Uncharacterized protein n=1 Tax=Owenia fusiformis TaxID=6347 RepID=A0A8J1Y2L5_OWEFU|nr:unnamed protein product [Owenia fusiformis]
MMGDSIKDIERIKINKHDENGSTHLIQAVRLNGEHLKILSEKDWEQKLNNTRDLLKRGANVKVTNTNGVPPLDIFLKDSYVYVVDVLNSDVLNPGDVGTLEHFIYGWINIIKLLKHHGADMNPLADGETPLMFFLKKLKSNNHNRAIISCLSQMIKVLIDNGAIDDRRIPLEYALCVFNKSKDTRKTGYFIKSLKEVINYFVDHMATYRRATNKEVINGLRLTGEWSNFQLSSATIEQEFGSVSQDTLPQKYEVDLSEKLFVEISSELIDEVQKLGIKLNLKHGEVESIKTDNSRNSKDWAYHVLKKWLQKDFDNKQNHNILIGVMEDIDRHDIAKIVKDFGHGVLRKDNRGKGSNSLEQSPSGHQSANYSLSDSGFQEDANCSKVFQNIDATPTCSADKRRVSPRKLICQFALDLLSNAGHHESEIKVNVEHFEENHSAQETVKKRKANTQTKIDMHLKQKKLLN